MRSIWIAGGFVLGALVACASSSSDDGGAEPGTDAGGKDAADPGTPIDDKSDAGGDASTTPDPDEDAGELDTRGGIKKCVAQAGTHHVLSAAGWSKANDTISFSSLTTTVTNSEGNDGNYLTVYVGTKGTNDYVKSFDSGPILQSGVAVPVPLPPNFSIPADKSLRIDHFFVGTGGPLKGPCYMYF